MRIGHLHAQLQERGFAWRTQSQVRYRLRWMEAAGIVERVALSRYPQYALTASGRRLIKKVVHSG
jgi:repressor of nif and glnA expression